VSEQASLAPFTTLLDMELGTLDPEREVTERRLADMRGLYLEEPTAHDRVVYRVYAIPAPATGANLLCCTTVLLPGTVGREYHMTKGHFHPGRDRAEVYLGLAGEGRLVMATDDGRHAVEPIRGGTISYVPGGWAHRSVNVGDQPLVFFAAYVGDAGHDYDTVERRGLPVLVVAGNRGPEVVANPRYRR
jgi:glucose-6-phosphate isomerase, archaeal